MIVNFNNFGDKIVKQKIVEIFKIALQETNNKDNVSANITVVGRQKIKEMNTEYRNVNRVTDVLSFPMLEGCEFCGQEMQDENITTDLGDIVICKSKVLEQAKEYGHSYQREFCFLALHGFLHILGYDHIEKEDEKVMFSLQDKILKKAQMER
ncbi:MAG: rRNA maturation RNase YbeY [Clostridia bacterium]|nr:rRNA maturation RNase YbeY [Clostridia bacterium]